MKWVERDQMRGVDWDRNEVRWDGTGWDTSDDGMGLERMGQQWVHRLPVVGHREVHGPVNTQ